MFENGDKAEAKSGKVHIYQVILFILKQIKCFFLIIHAEYEGGDVSGLCKV